MNVFKRFIKTLAVRSRFQLFTGNLTTRLSPQPWLSKNNSKRRRQQLPTQTPPFGSIFYAFSMVANDLQCSGTGQSKHRLLLVLTFHCATRHHYLESLPCNRLINMYYIHLLYQAHSFNQTGYMSTNISN